MPQTGQSAPSPPSIPNAVTDTSRQPDRRGQSDQSDQSDRADHADGLRPTLGLSPAQVAGSALAAVTGAVCASWLGVAGTIIGAGLGSVIATVGSASYTYSLRRGHQVVLGETPSIARPLGQTPARTGQGLPWPRLALGAAVVLMLGLGTLTLVEGLAGRSVSSMASGSSGGTTLGQFLSPSSDHQTSKDQPGTAPSDEPSTPATSQEPSPTQAPQPPVTDSAEPSPTPTESTSPGPTPASPTPTP